jgi:hypothetical protein
VAGEMTESLAFLFLTSLGSLGLTVKKLSRRPCCFVLRRAMSLSAPLRTRSSLQWGKGESGGRVKDGANTETEDHSREALVLDEELNQTFDVGLLPDELLGNRKS